MISPGQEFWNRITIRSGFTPGIEVCLNALRDISVFRLRVGSDGAEKFRTELVILLQRNQTLIAK
jgi:hypothetical protein